MIDLYKLKSVLLGLRNVSLIRWPGYLAWALKLTLKDKG